MDRISQYLTSATLTIIFLTLVFAPADAFSQQESLQDGPTVHNAGESSPVKTYPENLDSLVDYFDSKGVDIKDFLNDPRFKLYDGISKRFINAAEYKAGSFENYKTVLGFDNKKDRIYEFMSANSAALDEAEEKYGISRHVISAIIGVESSYGKVVGKYNPFNAYVSMYSEEYRAEFAQSQLEELLLFTERNNLDVFELKSSYAGAMSYAQFIPYSLNRWFVGDNLADMDNNIYSVANYLAHFLEITGSIEKAVYRYNPSQMYTDAVMALAKEAENNNTAK
ncbi:MAG: lytic murein transglycosylase [Balneolaceae bacterium]